MSPKQGNKDPFCLVKQDSGQNKALVPGQKVTGQNTMDSGSDDEDELLLLDVLLESDSDEEPENEPKRKVPRIRRQRPNYWESSWGKLYRSGDLEDPTSRACKKFRRRWVLPEFSTLQELIRLAHDEMGYSQRETHNGRRVPPLPLKVLGYLRVVGRGHSFDDVEENTGISETAFRVFFHDFSERGARFLYPMFVSMPSSAAEIRKVEEHYARVGMPGCCGSTDVVHVWWDACPAMLRSAHKGKESYPTRAFSVLPVLICVRGVLIFVCS